MGDVQCNQYDKNISSCRAILMLDKFGHGEDIWLQCKGKFLKINHKALERLKFKFTSATSKHTYFSSKKF